MRAIDPRILDCTIYLYPSRLDANNGERAGGSGFLVGVDSQVCAHVYAVTAKHVILDEKSPVIRLNTTEGDFEVLDVKQDSWKPHPDGDDVAVCPIELDSDKHKFTHIPLEMFITPEVISRHGIGPGDEVFMVGRFVNHEGKQRNLPTARFGNISMMTDEPIRHPSGIMQESFVVEVRSLSGYSGSPVFVWIPCSDWRTRQLVMTLTLGPWLLGVDWGHILDWQKVYEPDKKTRVSGNWVVKGNTGMAGIVPAWRLAQLLNSEELKADRQKKDQEAMKRKQESPMTLDSNKHEQKSSN